MTDHQDPLLLDHEADGIRELDNELPRWWVWLFVFSTVFAVIYMFYFHVFDIGKGQQARHAAEVERAEAAIAAIQAEKAANAPEVASAPVEPSTDETILAEGQTLFMTQCLACHMAQGQGLVGPNLCDEYWIHGNTFADNLHIINEGVPAKGMITWKNVLSQDQIYAVASYIYTLRGTNPPGPKAPEGEKYEM